MVFALVACACAGGGKIGEDGGEGEPGPEPPCGTGTWRYGTLEIHHIAVGQGDATLIVGPSGRSLLYDVGEPRWDGNRGASIVGPYVRDVLGCARLDYVMISHFHADHVGYPEKGGLWHLVMVQGFTIGRTLHRDGAAYLGDMSGTFGKWRDLFAGPGRAWFNPEVVRKGAQAVDLGRAVNFTVVALDGGGALRAGDFSADRAPPNENDYSIVARLRYGQLDYCIGGDLSGELWSSGFGYTYHDIESKVARELPDVDVYRANHHGSDHSSSPTLLAQIDPEVSVVSAGKDNPYGHPRQETVDRLLATSSLYLTERGAASTDLRGMAKVAGHVVLRTRNGLDYTVNGDAYRASDPVRVDADGDGYFREADSNDASALERPAPRGGCNPLYQPCP